MADISVNLSATVDAAVSSATDASIPSKPQDVKSAGPDAISQTKKDTNTAGSDQKVAITDDMLQRMSSYGKSSALKKEALQVLAKKLSKDKLKGLRSMFKQLDIDGNGTLSVEEFTKGTAGQLGEEDVKALVACLDVDQSGTIEYSEFLAALADAPVTQEDLLEAFKRFDHKGSGIITVKELQEGLARAGITDTDDLMAEVDTDCDGCINYYEFCEHLTAKDC